VNTRVVGGKPAGRRTIPFASGLVFHLQDFERRESIRPFCGGTLITDRHIVTAAHCLRGRSPGEVDVDVGDYSLMEPSEGELVPVKKLTIFPEYIPNKFHTDIGIIELKHPVNFSLGIQTAKLPNPDLDLKPGTTVFVFGWGRLSYTGGNPDELQAVDLPVVENKKCQKKFVSTIESRMICAGGQEGKDACIGDSGSGLIVRLDNDIVLCGVVSFGRRCALPEVPGVYTRVSSFVEWIQKETKASSCRPCVHGSE